MEVDWQNLVSLITLIVGFAFALLRIFSLAETIVKRVISQVEAILRMDIDKDGYISKGARGSDINVIKP
jgi:hypothetical protein